MPRTWADMPLSPPDDREHARLSRRALLNRALPAAGLAHIALTNPQPGEALTTEPVARVKSDPLLLTFQADSAGLALTSIENTSNGFNHLKAPSSIFGLAVEPSLTACESNRDVVIQHVDNSKDSRTLQVTGRAAKFPIQFSLNIASSPDHGVALVQLTLNNLGKEALTIRATAPHIEHIVSSGPHGPFMAAVPQEACGVASYEPGSPNLGMLPNPKIGLPTAMNFMELASVYDPHTGSGIFFADVEGEIEGNLAPTQFQFADSTVSGHWRTTLKPGEETSPPKFAIGIHANGDWHSAVDYYVRQHRHHWHFPEIPSWFRDQGAIYSFSGAGAGSIYMEYPQQDLRTRINSFFEIPKLLEEAQSLGTNILYLWDYWQGTPEGGRPQYWNKGDYIPRSDLGGDQAFKEGIRKLHQLGGRVIVYVESFVLFYFSHIGKEKGAQWAARKPDNSLYDHYPQNYSLLECLPAWHDYLAKVSERLVRDFDVDGIFLDSLGWQMNWPAKAEESRLYSPAEYSKGVLTLADRVRQTIQAIKPDLVVIGENASGALPRHGHGGLTADFAWLGGQNQHRVVASPVRYGIPEANLFSNGHNLNEMHQIFAAGHSLALANLHLPDAAYIQKLVRIRQEYKDALIYGTQAYQPKTGHPEVAAYVYRGVRHNVITAVNCSESSYRGNLQLEDPEDNSIWKDLLSKQDLTAAKKQLPLEVEGRQLRVLVQAS